ncbi:MAG TPA: hypothetical protein PK340_05380 [Bacilli bacterium]|nr:hypothetical protein [Bacilli bacterium]
MKKKLILLPLLMLALGACGSSVTPSSSSSAPASSQTPSSEAPVVDENVYRLTGNFYDPGWEPNSEFVMTRVGTENKFVYEELDLFVDEEWAITINGDWAGQIGFTGTTNLEVIDTGETMGLGGGPGTVKNFKVVTDGNYDIELNTGVSPRTVTITRNGDPVDVPVVEVDTEEWHLVGTMTDPQWTMTDKSYPLLWDAGLELYSGTFALDADAMFKIGTETDTSWTYARGASHVDVDDPAPAWLDLTDSGGGIKLTEAGNYKIDFLWIASVGATVNGVITITKLADSPIDIPAVSVLAANAVDDVVTVTDAYVVSNLGSASIMVLATPEGTVSVNYYSSEATLKADIALVANETYINVTGSVAITTGGDTARAKHILPTAFSVGAGAWEPGEMLSAATIDMDTGFKAFAESVGTDTFSKVYTFTNVIFMSVGSAAPTTTSYDYMNYNARVDGKNDLGATNYYRLGIYHFALDAEAVNTVDTYTVTAYLIGANRDVPFVEGGNPIMRLSGYVVVTPQTPAV